MHFERTLFLVTQDFHGFANSITKQTGTRRRSLEDSAFPGKSRQEPGNECLSLKHLVTARSSSSFEKVVALVVY
jgi:hypothetical protein